MKRVFLLFLTIVAISCSDTPTDPSVAGHGTIPGVGSRFEYNYVSNQHTGTVKYEVTAVGHDHLGKSNVSTVKLDATENFYIAYESNGNISILNPPDTTWRTFPAGTMKPIVSPVETGSYDWGSYTIQQTISPYAKDTLIVGADTLIGQIFEQHRHVVQYNTVGEVTETSDFREYTTWSSKLGMITRISQPENQYDMKLTSFEVK